MSDTFPDETLYPVLTSLADEDRIFASNSAAGHESSQIKGSTIKKTSAYTFHNGGEATGVPWRIHGCNGTVVLTLPAGVPIGTEIGVFVGVTMSASVTITRAGSDMIYTPSGAASSFSVTGFGRYFTVVKTTSSSWNICGLEDSAIAASLAGKAPLASPALTGTPTAPTAAAGTNTTQLATTAFVTGAVAGVTASSIGLGSVDNTSDINKPLSTAQAAAIAASRPKHAYTGITTAGTAIAAERSRTYGVNANGCTLTLPATNTAGYVDGDEICVVLGLTYPRTLTITSPGIISRGTGLQPVDTPFNVTGCGTFISFVKASNVWMMSHPEYALDGKAPLASPALTGTPTAPTAAVGTNTTQLATTAFCAAGFLPRFEAVVERTAATTAEPNKLYVNVKADAGLDNTLMLTLPSPTGNAGKVIGLTSRYRQPTSDHVEANWQLTGHIDGISGNTYWQGYWEIGSALLWCDGTTWHMLTDWRAESTWYG